MYKLKYILLSVAFLFASCDGKDAEKAAASEQALTNYRDYVTKFEQDSISEIELRALQLAENDSVAWETEKADQQKAYEAYRLEIENNLENLTDEQRAEAEQLDQRFKNALETREHQFQDVSHRYKLRQDLLGLDIEDDDLSEVTAKNIGLTYTRFVSTLQKQSESYQNRDWLLIDGWWSALNSRYRTLEGKLPGQVKKTVQQAQNQYKEIRPKEDVSEQDTQKPQQR